ncbi:Mre11 complex subunit Nbs1 [Ancistrocladus abbreviatus]
MAWGLFSVDFPSGEDKYYIFARGTYKVGRKGCDIIISKDKGVSRIHAEILVDAMECLDHPEDKSSSFTTNVRVRDCSKYGTFVARKDGSKKKVHECSGKETIIEDGDLISFGTGTATYRFSYFRLMFYFSNSKASQVTHSIKEKASSIGARISENWTKECTHVIVDQYTEVNEVLIDAIVAKKPFVLHNWLEFLAETKICSEIPSCSDYVPTLIVDEASVAVADSRTRESCLKGYKFMLGSSHLYRFGNRLPLLLEVGGAEAIETSGSNSQGLEDGQNNRIVQVIPAGSADCSWNQGSFLKINEMNLLRAVISGYLDPSVFISPSIVVSSSFSTDETIVADSDAETESATSDQPAGGIAEKEAPSKDEKSGDHSAPSIERNQMTNFIGCYISTVIPEEKDKVPAELDRKGEGSGDDVALSSRRDDQKTNFVEHNDRTVIRVKNDDGPESGNSDILYSQNLIVRDVSLSVSTDSATDSQVINFKRFSKTAIRSGNSFNNLVPFAKHPYTDSDYESKEVIKYVREEKKRKQMEAIAEDLFNNEKGRRRGALGSLRGLLTSR